MGRLANKVCVITGSASGIGRAAARAFVAEGATVGVLDRNTAGVDAVVAELGERAFPLVTDVTDEASVAAAFAEVKRRFDRLDVLYTCAAIQLLEEDGPVYQLPTEVWDRTHAINLRGVFLCNKYATQLMIAAGNGGSIINCGSPTGLTMCGADWPAYSASKAGVMGLTRAMAPEVAKFGIRVNGIVPGSIRTGLTEGLFSVPEKKAELDALHPIGRSGVPEDMAGIAVFLASDESAFATGSHFNVDGGISLR